jgi:hypothetical protein
MHSRPYRELPPTAPLSHISVTLEAARSTFAICDLRCKHCARCLAVITRRTQPLRFLRRLRTRHHLHVPDFCRWCSRPMSVEAQEQCPLEGYVSFVRAFLRKDQLAS